MPDCEIVKMLKALADPNRLTILEMIGDDELCSFELLEKMDISQPTLSHHLHILSESGLIVRRKDAQWIHYSIDKMQLAKVRDYLSGTMNGQTS